MFFLVFYIQFLLLNADPDVQNAFSMFTYLIVLQFCRQACCAVVALVLYYAAKIKQEDFLDFSFFTGVNIAASAGPKFHCVGGCWDRTQDSCDYSVDC